VPAVFSLIKRSFAISLDDIPDIGLLKYRSYIVSQQIPDKIVTSDNYQKMVLEMVRELQPFMAFLNRAISNG
jgi:uncharacterized protein (DUF2461 family)